ncbi:MAG: tetratricopeptide repeat protein, partial [Sulfurihydrogenibium sp.]|nr:tetratricopeptide repeat protein [Sulfurihydrogenibium sp.]
MKKVLGSLALFGILATGGMVYAQQEIDACWKLNNDFDFEGAIKAGKLAVKKYPKNSKAYQCLGLAYYNYYTHAEMYFDIRRVNLNYLNKFRDLAYKNMKKAESLTDNKEDLMYIYKQIGDILSVDYLGSTEKYDDALLYYNKSLNLAKELNNTDIQAAVLKSIADIYNNKGELDKALSYYEKYLSLEKNEEKRKDTYEKIATIYTSMGELYKNKGDKKTAKEYYTRAYNLYKSIG